MSHIPSQCQKKKSGINSSNITTNSLNSKKNEIQVSAMLNLFSGAKTNVLSFKPQTSVVPDVGCCAIYVNQNFSLVYVCNIDGVITTTFIVDNEPVFYI